MVLRCRSVTRLSPVRVTLVASVVGAALVGGMTMFSRDAGDMADFRPALAAQTSATPTRTPTPTTTAPTTTAPTTTTTAPTTSTPPPTQTQQVFALVNQYRAQHGCQALQDDPRLDDAAQAHSVDMATRHYFSHTTPSGITFDKRELAAGYPSPGGENIAMGQTSAGEVMTDWMNSAGHRANILNCQFTAIGVGLDTNGWYWTQDFGY
jgi:uncharacterized protein YkwD